MAQITITVPDPVVSDVLDAYAAKFGRPDQVEDLPDNPGTFIPNPETKAQFAKRMVSLGIKKVYMDRRRDVRRAAMEADLLVDADAMSGVE